MADRQTTSSGTKPKNRISFNSWQLSVLEANFSEQQYVTSTQRASLAKYLGITEIQVKVWFQNRRIRWRREMKSRLTALKGGTSRPPCN